MVIVLWQVNAILGNGCGIQGQNYVEMKIGFHYRNFILGIYCHFISLTLFSVGLRNSYSKITVFVGGEGGRVIKWEGEKGGRVKRLQDGKGRKLFH